MRFVAASTVYSSPLENSRALGAALSFAHRRFGSVSDYERAFALAEGSAFAVATSMARIGLFHILKSLDLCEGDRILLSPINIPEMRAVIESLKLHPVFVDFNPDSLTINTEDLRLKAAGARVLFVTHVAGQIGPMQEWRKIANDHDLKFIQDATQANGSFYRGKPLATWCDFSIFSTCELKFVHTYRGGMICVNDPELHRRLRDSVGEVRNSQGTGVLLKKWFINTGAFTVLHPHLLSLIFHHFHGRIFTQDPLANFETPTERIGSQSIFGNDYSRMRQGPPKDMLYRASDFESKLGMRELARMPSRIARHRQIASAYIAAFKDTGHLPTMSADVESSFWRFPLLFKNSDAAEKFRNRLLQNGIIAERSGLSLLEKDLPHAKRNIENTLLIPCHTGLTDSDVQRIIRTARSALGFA